MSKEDLKVTGLLFLFFVVMPGITSYRSVLKEEIEELRRQISDVSAQIAKASNNTDIDKQISDLWEKQREHEQAKADAKKFYSVISSCHT